MLNWFGRTYYGTNNEFKRPIKYAFRMWLKHDVLNKLTGKGNFAGTVEHKFYRWNKKKVWEQHKKANPLKSASYSEIGTICLKRNHR